MNLNIALAELPKLSREAATLFVKSVYSGHHQDVLLDFVEGRLSVDQVKSEWFRVIFTGNLLRDVKDDTLTVVNRLELVAFIIRKLGFTGKELENDLRPDYSKAELVKALSVLVNDLNKKDNLKVRSEEGRGIIEEKLNAYFKELEESEDLFSTSVSEDSSEKEESLAPTPCTMLTRAEEETEEDALYF